MTFFLKNEINKLFQINIKIFLLVLMLTLISGCGNNPEELLWKKALHDTTGIFLEEYKTLYPNGRHIKECDIKLELKAYSYADKTETLESFIDYLDKYPKSGNTHQIKSKLYKLLFTQDDNINLNLDPRVLLTKYLILKPNGEYAEQAKNAIDNVFWLETCIINTHDAYLNYANIMANGMYYEEAGKKLKKYNVNKLYLGMTPVEIEDIFFIPFEKEQMYAGVKNISNFGNFYIMKYPNLGISCKVRKHNNFEKVFSLSFNEEFSGSYNNMKIGMLKEDVIKILDTSKINNTNDFEIFYKDEDKNNSKSGLYIRFCHYENDGSFEDIRISADKHSYKTYLVKNNKGLLNFDSACLELILSGKKLYVKRNIIKNSVMEITHSDDDMRGNFFILPY